MLDGKPLAFLAQIDLATLDPASSDLPKDGLLLLFSAWGWCEDEGYPDMMDEDGETQTGWTVLHHMPKKTPLSRRPASDGVQVYSEAPFEVVAVSTLPSAREEAALAAQDWDDATLDRYWDMTYDYRSAQMGHWLGQSSSSAPHTLIGGYPMLEHGYPEGLPAGEMTSLLQLSSIGSGTDMDFLGGHLLFYGDRAALRSGDFSNLWGTCQPG